MRWSFLEKGFYLVSEAELDGVVEDELFAVKSEFGYKQSINLKVVLCCEGNLLVRNDFKDSYLQIVYSSSNRIAHLDKHLDDVQCLGAFQTIVSKVGLVKHGRLQN
ncbi:hypothetical protein H5410_024651 [Solanum commersonii]|uniref:Uncharacterized protein n=1 Tax=Solanum commersonii TaxID=4109 RepID=A0A9J5ZMM9_SOLCO|nr:hypothetical protein H5410_024651 [Solanum commersonii]